MCSKPMFECHQATHTGNAFEPRLAHKRAQTSWRPNSRPRKKGNVRASQNQTEPNRTKRGKNIPPGPRAHAPHQYSPGSRLAVIFRNRCEPKVGLLWPSAPGAHKTSDGRGGRSQDTNSQARARNKFPSRAAAREDGSRVCCVGVSGRTAHSCHITAAVAMDPRCTLQWRHGTDDKHKQKTAVPSPTLLRNIQFN